MLRLRARSCLLVRPFLRVPGLQHGGGRAGTPLGWQEEQGPPVSCWLVPSLMVGAWRMGRRAVLTLLLCLFCLLPFTRPQTKIPLET